LRFRDVSYTCQIRTTFSSALSPSFSNWTVFSDKTLKQNIVDVNLQMAYDNFKTLNFKRFSYIDTKTNDKNLTGLIAQDIKKTCFRKSVIECPYYQDIKKMRKIKKIIQEEKLGSKIVIDENGKSTSEKTIDMIDDEIEVDEEFIEHKFVENKLTLNYDEINKTALCVIQKLQSIVEEQQQKINNLEDIINRIDNRSEKNRATTITILENRLKNMELLMEEVKEKLNL
jgi:hypothetical protein